jgi:hypothetical protein
MPHVYEQSSGRWIDPQGLLLATGYAGVGIGLNEPELQSEPFVGPIPEGLYLIGEPRDTIKHGPYALPLTPDAANEMYGRSDMMVHGDEIAHPGQHLASEGCIILPRPIREQIWASGDRALNVVANYVPQPVMTVTDTELGM